MGLIALEYAYRYTNDRDSIAALSGTLLDQDATEFGIITGIGGATIERHEGFNSPFVFHSGPRGIGVDLPALGFQTRAEPPSSNDYTAVQVAATKAIGAVYSDLESSGSSRRYSTSSPCRPRRAFSGHVANRAQRRCCISPGSQTSAEQVDVSHLFPNTPQEYGQLATYVRSQIALAISGGFGVVVPNTLVHINGWDGGVFYREGSDAQGLLTEVGTDFRRGDDARWRHDD